MGVRRGFTIAPENVFLPLEIRYQDSLGNFNQATKVFFNGMEYDGTDGALQGITLEDLLEAAGVNLDDYNDYLCIVGEDEANGGCTQGSTTGLTYRMTGIKLLVTVKFESVHYLEPMNNRRLGDAERHVHSIQTNAQPWNRRALHGLWEPVALKHHGTNVYRSGDYI